MRIGFVIAKGCVAIFTLTTSVVIAVAQSNNLPNPADPDFAVPVVNYESAFSDYQRFREQKSNSWKQVNKEVADNPGMGSMGSMKDMPGKAMPGMDSKTADAPINKEGAGGHDMDSMKDMPGRTMPGMDSKTADAPMSKEGAGGHDMGSMKDMPNKPMPGMDKKAATSPKSKKGAGGPDMGSMKDMPDKTMPDMDSKTADAPMSKKGHGEMAMAKPDSATGPVANAQTAGISGTGIVQGIDKANGKVKLTHDPIAALGWPKMTMFFRLKDSTLANQVKEGDKVEFALEKSASGYVISGFQKGSAGHDMKQMKK